MNRENKYINLAEKGIYCRNSLVTEEGMTIQCDKYHEK